MGELKLHFSVGDKKPGRSWIWHRGIMKAINVGRSGISAGGFVGALRNGFPAWAWLGEGIRASRHWGDGSWWGDRRRMVDTTTWSAMRISGRMDTRAIGPGAPTIRESVKRGLRNKGQRDGREGSIPTGTAGIGHPIQSIATDKRRRRSHDDLNKAATAPKRAPGTRGRLALQHQPE